MNWEKDYNEALQYASAAEGMAKSKKLDNETLYHVICLSIEKFTSAIAAKVNYIPAHSGLNLIFRELAKKIEIPDTFHTEVRFINGFMTYCSLDFEEPKPISQNDLTRMITFLEQLKGFTYNQETTVDA
jgi:hypothetical protein